MPLWPPTSSNSRVVALRWRVREIVNELLKDLPHSPINSLVSLECNLGRRPIIVEEAWLSTGYASYDFVDLNLVVSLEGDTVEVVADVCGAAARGSFCGGGPGRSRSKRDAAAGPRDAATRRCRDVPATPSRTPAAMPPRDERRRNATPPRRRRETPRRRRGARPRDERAQASRARRTYRSSRPS